MNWKNKLTELKVGDTVKIINCCDNNGCEWSQNKNPPYKIQRIELVYDNPYKVINRDGDTCWYDKQQIERI